MTRWVLADYGEVISDPVRAETIMLDHLGATPQSVLFIDDRAENALAATALGLQAVRFTSAEELPGQLEDWDTSMR